MIELNLFFFSFIEFLKIDFRDKLQVQYALGHQTRAGLELYSRESDNLEQLDIRTAVTETSREESSSSSIKSKDKEKLIERLRQSVEGQLDVCFFFYVYFSILRGFLMFFFLFYSLLEFILHQMIQDIF